MKQIAYEWLNMGVNNQNVIDLNDSSQNLSLSNKYLIEQHLSSIEFEE